MANTHDSQIVRQLMEAEKQYGAAGLRKLVFSRLPEIQDDTYYWQSLAASWIKCGRTEEIMWWRRLFGSPRPRRWKLMKKKDRQIWRKLPNTVVAYRACATGEDLDFMISWTLDHTVLSRIYKDTRTIATGHFPKSKVLAYFNRREEHEIIVL